MESEFVSTGSGTKNGVLESCVVPESGSNKCPLEWDDEGVLELFGVVVCRKEAATDVHWNGTKKWSFGVEVVLWRE
jgi:hypothetical protein